MVDSVPFSVNSCARSAVLLLSTPAMLPFGGEGEGCQEACRVVWPRVCVCADEVTRC